jgi:hypothetical protein
VDKVTINPDGDIGQGDDQEKSKQSRQWFRQIVTSGADGGRLFFCLSSVTKAPFSRIIVYNDNLTKLASVALGATATIWSADSEEKDCQAKTQQQRDESCSSHECAGVTAK